MSRRQLLDEYFTVTSAIEELTALPESPRILAHQDIYVERASRRWNEYIAQLPRVPLSRCPLTGDEFRHSLDRDGLDGLWWRYESPARPLEKVPPTLFALTGAMRLTAPVEWTPFLVKPGPEAPYVIPKLLNRPTISAVVSSVKVGAHTGYAVAYFSRTPETVEPPNPWGSTGPNPDAPNEYDFDVARWITAGKLFWIAPGDDGLRLRTDGACPYISLPGRRDIVRIQRGQIW